MKANRAYRGLFALPVLGLGIALVSLRDLPAQPVEREAIARLEPTRVLRADVLHESDALAAPTDVEVIGHRLVIADDFADRPLSVLSRSSGEMLRSFGRKGRGPREFESVFALDVVDPSGEFMVHDLMLQRVTWIDLEEDFQGDAWVADRSVRLNATAMITETSWSRDGLKGLGMFQEGRVGHLDRDGRLLRTSGPTPMEGEEVPPTVRQQAFQSRLKSDPARRRWAVATRYSDRLEIYDAQGRLTAQGERPYGFEPVFEMREGANGPSMSTGADLRFGYLDLATTSTRIYALFSGRTRAEGSANFGRRIHVYDWDGRLIEIWELDSALISLAVSPEGDRLYGIRHAPMPAVVTFGLDADGGRGFGE